VHDNDAQSLEEDGRGRVLVVDGGASMRCALLGDNIAEMAYKNGWSVSLLINRMLPKCTTLLMMSQMLHRGKSQTRSGLAPGSNCLLAEPQTTASS